MKQKILAMSKNIITRLFALILIFLLSPLLLVIAVMIRVDSRGPVFFCQQRVGLNGQMFRMVKFRTMVVGAHNIGGYSTSSSDARITRLGRYLRKSSLDELPQLFNIIVGTMNFIGPRPDVEQQLEGYSREDLSVRLSVLPGVTGLAQSTLRSSATFEERLSLDLEYVHNSSVLLDMKIIIDTVVQVLRRGSH